jgi:hypothetical protein
MTRWVRNAVVLVTIAVWSVVVLYSLVVNKVLPDPATWLVPPGVWAAVHAPIPGQRANGNEGES